MMIRRTTNLCHTVVFCFLLAGCLAINDEPVIFSTNTVPLITTLDEGVADSQVIPIRWQNSDAWLALDTGAPFTFLFSDPAGPEFVKNAGTIKIGCETWEVPGYRDEAIGVEIFLGKPIVGVLGLDFFLDCPAEINYPGGHLIRYLNHELPPSDEELPTIPLHGHETERALIDVVLEEVTLTLMLDTGAHDTILIDTVGNMDDEETMVQTADGQQSVVYLGEATLSLPKEAPRLIPVMRASDIPYIAPELREINTQGLLGLTALGWRRVIIDFANGKLRFGPICDEHMLIK